MCFLKYYSSFLQIFSKTFWNKFDDNVNKWNSINKTNANRFYRFAQANASTHSINIDLASSVRIKAKATIMQIRKL